MSLLVLGINPRAGKKRRRRSWRARTLNSRFGMSIGLAFDITEVATILLQIEQLYDCNADDEFADLGVEEPMPCATIADLQRCLWC